MVMVQMRQAPYPMEMYKLRIPRRLYLCVFVLCCLADFVTYWYRHSALDESQVNSVFAVTKNPLLFYDKKKMEISGEMHRDVSVKYHF